MGRLLLLLFLIAMAMVVVASRDHCRKWLQEDSTQDDVTVDLMFVPTPKSVDNTCVNQQVELVCCAHNYRLLRWYHYDNTSSHTWEEVKLSSHVYHSPEGDNRTLVLQKPALSDRGWYRCTAEDGMGHKISHNISLYIEECPSMADVPTVSLVPEDVLYRQPGAEINLTCNVYFGLNYQADPEARLVWKRKTGWENGSVVHDDVWIPASGYMPSDPRLDLSLSMENDTQRSVLTIHNLSLADYGNYTCRALNTIGWSKPTIAILLRGDPNRTPFRELEETDPVGPPLLRILAAIVSVVICVSLLGFVLHKDVLLLYKDNLAKPRNPDAQYDALIIYNEHHSPDCLFVVKSLLPVLEDKYGYQLCIAERDFIAGPDLVDVIVDNIEASQAIVFVVTEAMLQQEWCDFVFQYVAAREYTNLVFIMCEPIRDQAWHRDQGPLRNIIDSSKHVFSWPGDSRKSNNFWKELRLSLPAKLSPVRASWRQSNTPLCGNSQALLYV